MLKRVLVVMLALSMLASAGSYAKKDNNGKNNSDFENMEDSSLLHEDVEYDVSTLEGASKYF